MNTPFHTPQHEYFIRFDFDSDVTGWLLLKDGVVFGKYQSFEKASGERKKLEAGG